MTDKSCLKCRFHSKAKRPVARGVADAGLEVIELEDEDQIILFCRHESAGEYGKEKGPLEAAPGSDCDLFQAPLSSGLRPELDELLKKRRGI